MKQVYLAHPLSADTQEGITENIRNAKLWYKWACDSYWPDHCFNMMWAMNCEVYDDADAIQRERGMQRNFGHLKRCDELWLVGLSVSSGMTDEGLFMRRCAKPVFNLTGFYAPPTVIIKPEDMPVWRMKGLSEQTSMGF